MKQKQTKVLKTIRLSKEHIDLIDNMPGSNFTDKIESVLDLYFLAEEDIRENIETSTNFLMKLEEDIVLLDARAALMSDVLYSAAGILTAAANKNCYNIDNSFSYLEKAKDKLNNNLKGNAPPGGPTAGRWTADH